MFVSIDVKKVLFTCIYFALRTCKLQCGTTRRECIMFRVSKLIKKKRQEDKQRTWIRQSAQRGHAIIPVAGFLACPVLCPFHGLLRTKPLRLR